jgi:hypothetical protein
MNLSEALKSNTSLTSLDLYGNRPVASFHSHSIGNDIGAFGAIYLSEALKSNTSLTSLDLEGYLLVPLFHSHSIQAITLVLMEESK